MPRILIVDDEPSICWGLERLVRSMGHRAESASSAEQGLTLAGAVRPDVVLLDVRLPGMDGLSAISAFRKRIGDAPIIVMTAFGDLSTAVTAVESGVLEYIVKPFDLAEIRAAIERALQSRMSSAAVRPLPVDAADGMVGQTPVMRAVFKRIALAAKSDANVLIVGERGVGKELAARAIHNHSDRRAGPFVVVDLAALDPTIADAELFGQVNETGGERPGLLSLANRGTLYLDGVDAMPMPLQARLIRVIEQGEFLPIGAAIPTPAEFRVISSGCNDMGERAAIGPLRDDLLLHLTTYAIEIPPLRDRRDDIPLLAAWYLGHLGADPAALTTDAVAELQTRPWHGNVRELCGAVEHALVVARSGPILPSHLPAPMKAPVRARAGELSPRSLEHVVQDLANTLLDDPSSTGDVYERFLGQVEPALFAAALGRSGNRCAPAARSLGLHRTTLRRKLARYQLDDADAEDKGSAGV
jgi:DNA-binding NtrC family response regulator